jgi:hypothetical protein
MTAPRTRNSGSDRIIRLFLSSMFRDPLAHSTTARTGHQAISTVLPTSQAVGKIK